MKLFIPIFNFLVSYINDFEIYTAQKCTRYLENIQCIILQKAAAESDLTERKQWNKQYDANSRWDEKDVAVLF